MNGFLMEFTDAHRASLDASEFNVIDFETTALTHTARPASVGKNTPIGGLPWHVYERKFAAERVCGSRARVLTVATSAGEILAWDLDPLSPADRRELVYAAVHGKTIVGHNLSFDLMWALHLAGPELQPAATVDTMLLVRVMRPALVWELHARAGAGDAACVEMVEAGKTNGPIGLAAVAVALKLGKLDKAYQKPENWSIKPLSQGHADYVNGDVTTPLEIILHIGKSRNFHDAMLTIRADDAIGRGSSFERIYSKVPLALAQISNRGLPVHVPTLEAIEAHRASLLEGLAEEVIRHIPAMRGYEAALKSTKTSVTREIKDILGAYADSQGFELGKGKDGAPMINSKNAMIVGVSDLLGWLAWEKLQGAKKILSLCSEARSISARGPDQDTVHLHPLASAHSATARVITKGPNIQNLPGPDPGLPDHLQFRSIVRALPGHKIVSADYSQIELRFAAALALRAIQETRDELQTPFTFGKHKTSRAPEWLMHCIKLGSNPAVKLNPARFGFEHEVAAKWRAASRGISPMAEAFRAGVDPHLMTGLRMATMQGIFDTGGLHPLDYLKQPGLDTKALTKQLKAQRQSAKPLNFGLLYGMQAKGLHALGITDYGLSWPIEEAMTAREAWFELYPEIAWWQTWTQLAKMRPKATAKRMFWRDRYTRKLQYEDGRLGYSSTLGGRPVVGTAARDVGNYSDQGSGADAMLEALVTLPEKASRCVINTIHDEILLHVPDADVEEVAGMLQTAMLASVNRVLAPWGIPTEADPDVSDFWTKN